MKPTRLELKNFGCYRDHQAIDFAATPSDLFAIAGPIGSGKSTLLDAITWVLYGQTPRLGQRLNEHIFTPGENDLAVVLEFTARERAYRATRALTRRPSGIKPDYKLERKSDDGRWLAVPETDKKREYEEKVASIVGLDYDGFTRAVILPQGTFDEFLRGDAAKRQELFKALLKAYTIERMRELAAERRKGLKSDLDKAKARLDEEYEGVTRERAAALVEEIGTLQACLEKRQAELDELGREAATLDEVRRLDGELRKAGADLAELAREREAVRDAREALERATAAKALQAVIKNHATRRRDREAARRAVETNQGQLVKAEAARDERAKALERARQARTERKPALQERLQRIEASREDAELLAHHAAGLALARESDGGPFRPRDLERLQTLLARVPHLATLERARDASAKELAAAREGVRRMEEGLGGRERALGELEAKGRELARTREAAKEGLDRARRENQALFLRQHLHEGDDCPVCRRVVNEVPEAGEEADVAKLETAFETADRALRDAREAYSAARESLKHERTRLEEGRAAIRDSLEPRAAAAQAALAEAREPFEADGKDAKEVQAHLESQRRTVLARLAARVAEVTGGREHGELRKEVAAALERLDEEVDAAHAASAEAAKRYEGVHATLTAARTTLANAERAAAEAEADLNEALGESRFESLDEAEAASLEEGAAAKLQRRIEEHERRAGDAATRKAAAEKGLAGRTYDAARHEAVRGASAQAKRQVEEDRQALGGKGEALRALRERLKDKATLERSIADLERKHAVAHALATALQTNNFEAHVLAHAQADLAATASGIIHEVSGGRYELTYREQEFFVRDTWMDSHERTVRTLSGGESFIVSLALALALSDTIAGQHTLGALFLDEGFGTLDGETLDSVTDVLTHLTSSGRVVGVITHVTSLTDRLPARLVIEKHPRGSTATWDA